MVRRCLNSEFSPSCKTNLHKFEKETEQRERYIVNLKVES